MGLNWAAALDNFSRGMGQIAQVKYSEFMRQDENKRREKEREIDFQRQKNLARFQVDAQKDMQAAGFTHAENLQKETMTYNRERAASDDKFKAEQMILSRQQVANSGAAAAANAAESRARMDMLREQMDQAKTDRQLQGQLAVFKIPLENANSQITDLMKARNEAAKNMGDTTEIDNQIMGLRQTAAAATNGMMKVYKDSGFLQMDPDMESRFNEVMQTPKENGQMPSFMEALDRAMRPVAAPATAAPGDFLPPGGQPLWQSDMAQDPSERGIGGTVVSSQRQPVPAPKVNVPAGLRVPGSEPPPDYTVSGITPSGDYAVGGVGEAGKQVVPQSDEFNLTNGASMAAGDAALAGGGSTRDIGASVSVAMRNLSPVAQKEVSSARSAADLSPTTIDELRTKNYNPDTLIGYLRRNG